MPENKDQSTLIASVISARDSNELLTKECFLEMNAKITKIYHPKFEKCFKVTPENSKTSYLKVEYKSDVNGVRVFQKVYSGGNILRDNMHPNLVNEIDYSIEHVQKLCFDSWFIYKFFEFPYTDLRTLMKKRLNPSRPTSIFSTRDLNILLREQCQALAYLHNKGKFHASMKPSDITITREGKSKLWATSTVDTSKKFIHKQKNIMLNKGKLYQSPLMYDNLMNRNHVFKVKPKKEDSFALGLILIEAGTGLSCQELYKKRKRFDKERLSHMINIFEMTHRSNSELVQKVKSLCEINGESRKDANELVFEKVTKPVEPNTNVNSLTQKNPDSGFFYSNKSSQNGKPEYGEFFFNTDESVVKYNRSNSPNFSPNNSRKGPQEPKRNYTPSRNSNAFGSFGTPVFNMSFKKKNSINNDSLKQFNYNKKPSEKYIEPIYENQPYRPVSAGKYSYPQQTSKSVPKNRVYTYDVNRYQHSSNSNQFQTFGQITSIQEMMKARPDSNSKPNNSKDRFSFQKNQIRSNPANQQKNIKVFPANGNRGPSLRFQNRQNFEVTAETLFNKPKYQTEKIETKKAPIPNQPIYSTQVQRKTSEGNPNLNGVTRRYNAPGPQPSNSSNRIYNLVPKRHKSANINSFKNNNLKTIYVDYKFQKVGNPKQKNDSNMLSQTVSVSKTSSSNVDTFPVIQIGNPNAQSPIAVDREVSLKPKLNRITPLTINQNTLLSHAPLLSPSSKKKFQTEEHEIDAREFLEQQKDLGNYQSELNSKFNLLSQNFDDNYNTNNDLVSKDNSFQIDANVYFGGTPKDFDENFKIDANELFSQRLFNSNEMIGKNFIG